MYLNGKKAADGYTPATYTVNNGQIYPDLTNCQASVRHAMDALPVLRTPPPTPLAPSRLPVGV